MITINNYYLCKFHYQLKKYNICKLKLKSIFHFNLKFNFNFNLKVIIMIKLKKIMKNYFAKF